MNKKYQQPIVAIAHIIPANIIAQSPNIGVNTGTNPEDEVEKPDDFESKKRKSDDAWSEGLW